MELIPGQIRYCVNKLDDKAGERPCIILSVNDYNVEVLYITKKAGKWDYDKIDIEDTDVVNFKTMPSFVVLGIFNIGCMECQNTSFSRYITNNLKQKLREYGFNV